jgi:hypothetical protein
MPKDENKIPVKPYAAFVHTPPKANKNILGSKKVLNRIHIDPEDHNNLNMQSEFIPAHFSSLQSN